MSVSEKTSVIERLTKPAHLIDMKDIIREGNPTLRAIAEEVSFPLSDQEIILGEKMMQFLKHSQDPVMAEKMGLRGGVGLAAPQLDISKRLIAVLVPNPEDEEGNPPKEAARVTVEYFDKDGQKHRIKLKGYNAIVVQHEIDHINGIMFYDRINEKDPFAVKDGMLVIE